MDAASPAGSLECEVPSRASSATDAGPDASCSASEEAASSGGWSGGELELPGPDAAAKTFARRPSVGTWLAPRPEPGADELRGLTPWQTYLQACHPFVFGMLGMPMEGQAAEDELEGQQQRQEEEGGPEAQQRQEERPEFAWAAAEGLDFELAERLAGEFEALHARAAGVAAGLEALGPRFRPLLEESEGYQRRHGEALREQWQLRHRLAHLRRVLRRRRGLEEDGPSAGAAGAGAGAGPPGAPDLPFADGWSRLQVLQRLPEMKARASNFDWDEDGLGSSTIEELRQEAERLEAYAELLEAEHAALEAEALEARSAFLRAREENEKLRHRVSHLRTCVANAKGRRAEEAKDAAGSAEPKKMSRLSRGGC